MAGKAGEGSRGGHVIGHTKSGTPIYGSAADHAAKVDAGKAHGTEAGARHPDAQPADNRWKDAAIGGLIGTLVAPGLGTIIGGAIGYSHGKGSSDAPRKKASTAPTAQEEAEAKQEITEKYGAAAYHPHKTKG